MDQQLSNIRPAISFFFVQIIVRVLQSLKAVFTYFTSKRILPFGFAPQTYSTSPILPLGAVLLTSPLIILDKCSFY